MIARTSPRAPIVVSNPNIGSGLAALAQVRYRTWKDIFVGGQVLVTDVTFDPGTYLTMHHGHTAMFGTYGMLSVSLLLFSWRGLIDKAHWKDGLLKLSFFGLNIGLLLMAFVTLLPVGAMQAWTSFKNGLWSARSAEFFSQTSVVVLGTLRSIPDVIIIVLGVLPLAWFLITTYPHLKAKEIQDNESVWERLGMDL